MTRSDTLGEANLSKIRKAVAICQIVSGTVGFVATLRLQTSGQSELRGSEAIVPLLVYALANGAGALLLADRAGGVPLSLLNFGLQAVLVDLPFETRFWVVNGPYAVVGWGPDRAWAHVGLTLGFAHIAALDRAPPWVALNMFAVGAFWFLWRRDWRKKRSRSLMPGSR